MNKKEGKFAFEIGNIEVTPQERRLLFKGREEREGNNKKGRNHPLPQSVKTKTVLSILIAIIFGVIFYLLIY